ncbi:hypothetical protein FIV42_00625 [Persicimonas caeni]|uniref:Uncharacterized protein n=1 Tax=Persicimonas caeni TaxID=2292766 RepID=A0A4Y6PLX5_PERCE|nr:hypothetical protein [Persicimonas caeni]QDG49288.1 hypothetical protein FIV42_00625 [Persicimonas caeni]QED30509.1 hypothetical protein FRD00_00620 [Persicimonas caeni]
MKGCLVNVVLIAVIFGALGFAATELEPKITAALVAGVATVLVAVWTKYRETMHEVEVDLRKRRIEVYENLLEVIFDMYRKQQKDEPVDQEGLADRVAAFTRDLTLWGSDDIVRAWQEIQLKESHGAYEGFNEERVVDLDKLLLAIRRDSGHQDTTLGPGDLTSLYVTDAVQLFPSIIERRKSAFELITQRLKEREETERAPDESSDAGED